MLLVPCRASDVAAVAPVQATAKRSALCHCQELRSRMARFPRKPKAQKHKSQITRQALGFRVLSPARSWSWTDTETETEPQTRSFPASGQAPSPSLCAHPFSVSALPLKNSLKQRNALHLASSPASSLLGSRLTHKQFVFAFRWRGREPRSPVPSPQTGDHDSRSHHPKKKKKLALDIIITAITGPLACLSRFAMEGSSSQGFDFRKSILFWHTKSEIPNAATKNTEIISRRGRSLHLAETGRQELPDDPRRGWTQLLPNDWWGRDGPGPSRMVMM